MIKFQVTFRYTVEICQSDVDKFFHTTVKATTKAEAWRKAQDLFLAFLDVRAGEVTEIKEAA